MHVFLGAVHVLAFVEVFVSIAGEVDFVHLDWRVECDCCRLQGAVVGVGRRIRLDEDSSSGLASLRTSELLLRVAGVRRNEAPRRNESPYSLRGHRRTAHG